MFRWIRSLLFVVLMYLGMAVLGFSFAPFALFSRNAAVRACKLFCIWARWLAGWLVGIRTEVRGPIPTGEVLIASKHQSFLDIILIFHVLPRPKFIMKRELMWTPFIGLYARRMGCIPVDRAKRGGALAKMVRDVMTERRDPGQLVIYPQGTRVAPGDYKPYKGGIGILYNELETPCVPVATNVGLFWPRKGLTKYPGLAVVEFLEPVEPGLSRREFMTEIEAQVERQSTVLMREAGYEANELR